MPSRDLNDLDKRIRPLVDRLLARCANRDDLDLPVMVIDTMRTLEEQRDAVLHGTSWTLKSKHLPQPPDGKSLAIDLCPTAYMMRKNWNPAGELWWKLAEAGLALGLRSGMDWAGVGLPPVGHTRPSWDPGHLELRL